MEVIHVWITGDHNVFCFVLLWLVNDHKQQQQQQMKCVPWNFVVSSGHSIWRNIHLDICFYGVYDEPFLPIIWHIWHPCSTNPNALVSLSAILSGPGIFCRITRPFSIHSWILNHWISMWFMHGVGFWWLPISIVAALSLFVGIGWVCGYWSSSMTLHI